MASWFRIYGLFWQVNSTANRGGAVSTSRVDSLKWMVFVSPAVVVDEGVESRSWCGDGVEQVDAHHSPLSLYLFNAQA